MRSVHGFPLSLVALSLLASTTDAQVDDRLKLEDCVVPGTQIQARCGRYTVFENRDARSGRTIDLNIIVLPAQNGDPLPDPVFYLTGGPGLAATKVAAGQRRAWYGDKRDIVLVDQRGTGKSNGLDCAVVSDKNDLQGYLDPAFRVEVFEPCRHELEKIADLTQYTTPIAMDDLNEVRGALGYDKINLRGGSYGTRAALVYMRRHPETVRTAILNGVAPIAFRNPLYHAYEAQRALELTFEECAADEACHAAFPNLQQEFDAIISRLDAEAARVPFTDEGTGAVELEMTRYAFAEALRTTLYYMPGARNVPLLIHKAYEGDYEFFVDIGMQSNRGIVDILQFGMLLSVTCPEDLARIDPDEIPALTAGTFMRDDRVRNQLAACAVWPEGLVSDDYGEPVSVNVPTLVLSGTNDPVTSVRWGEEAASHLPNSLHVIAPGAHGVGGPCITFIQAQFLDTASVENIDAACVAEMTLPPFRTQ
jgi:pimeloyl-ACP methyl ester carboxylesterase